MQFGLRPKYHMAITKPKFFKIREGGKVLYKPLLEKKTPNVHLYVLIIMMFSSYFFVVDPSDFPQLDDTELSKLSAPEFRTQGADNQIQNIYRQIGQSVR